MVNGSEGILRAIYFCELESSGTHPTVAIFEFPACRDTFLLDGLPPGHYPIYPDSCPIKVEIYASGRQMPIQLGFSRTAHGAQGKTLSAVGSDFNFGGAMEFVIASRARDRIGAASTCYAGRSDQAPPDTCKRRMPVKKLLCTTARSLGLRARQCSTGTGPGS